MSVTLIIIIITGLVSYTAFTNGEIMDKMIFYPPAISRDKQWYRFFSNGLLHADFGHLLFNMLSLYMFGELVEDKFKEIFNDKGTLLYLIMYITALAVCLLPTYFDNKDNYHYRSLGASGAVSAVVFAGIFLYPLNEIGLFFIPPIIPGFIFAPIYLFISAYLSKRGGDHINHSAHIWGSIYGVAFTIIACLAFSDFRPVSSFLDQILSYFS